MLDHWATCSGKDFTKEHMAKAIRLRLCSNLYMLNVIYNDIYIYIKNRHMMHT